MRPHPGANGAANPALHGSRWPSTNPTSAPSPT